MTREVASECGARLVRSRLADPALAATAAVTTALVNQVVKLQDCDPAAAHTLGRGLTTGGLATSLLEPGDRINLPWRQTGNLLADTAPQLRRSWPTGKSERPDVGLNYLHP